MDESHGGGDPAARGGEPAHEPHAGIGAPERFMHGAAFEYVAPVLGDLARAAPDDGATRVHRLRGALGERYEIVRELGRGGMAIVFQARDRRFARDVALKVLREDGSRLANSGRFAREIAIVATLQHPHIVPLYDSGEVDGLQYFVMPYLRGETLRARIQREPRLAAAEALVMLGALASALDFAHANGVVHRDVKPENVLLLADGQALLLDFGIALALDHVADSRITDTGVTPGTRRYMSPEQLRGDASISAASDLYSLALVARETLFGEVSARTEPTSGASAATGDPHRSLTFRSAPPAIAAVFRRALAVDPSARFETGVAFVAAISNAMQPRRRGGMSGGRVAAVVRVGAGVAAALLISSGPSLPRSAERHADVSQLVVAVLPLSTVGPHSLRERALGEALVQPLAMQLDGSPELRAVDAGAVLAAARIGDRTDAQLAAALGATHYVSGSIVGLGGDRIRVFLSLRPVADDAGDAVPAEASGDIDHVIELVDSLARRLLVGLVPAQYREYASIADRTTRSSAALLAYLEGERLFRARRNDSATMLFNRAIEADSTFALAMHRLRVAYSSTPIALPGPRDLRQRTLRHARRLPARQRQLVYAFDAFMTSRPFEAESIYKAVLAESPHDVEALFFLADVQIHYGVNWGTPLESPQELLGRLLRIDPFHAGAIEHLLMIAGVQMRSIATDSLLPRLQALERGEYAIVTNTVSAFRRGDVQAQDRFLARLDSSPAPLVSMAVHRGGGVYPGHLAARIRIAELLTRPHRTLEQQTRGYLMTADIELARGRTRAADAARAAAARTSPDAMLHGILAAFVASPSFEHRSRTQIAETRASVADAMRSGARDSVRQRFLLGVLDARLGDFASAARDADELQRWSRSTAAVADSIAKVNPDEAMPIAQRGARLASLAITVRADVERRRGNHPRALELMREWHPERWWTFALHDAVRAQAYERRLMAEELEANGYYEEAARWYEVWHGPLIGGIAYSTTSRLRMARLLEVRLGRPIEAREAYLRVLEALKDADPELWDELDEARRGAARLAVNLPAPS